MAEIIDFSPRTLRNYRDRRLIPFIKIGPSVRYDPAEVMAALKRFQRPAKGGA